MSQKQGQYKIRLPSELSKQDLKMERFRILGGTARAQSKRYKKVVSLPKLSFLEKEEEQ